MAIDCAVPSTSSSAGIYKYIIMVKAKQNFLGSKIVNNYYNLNAEVIAITRYFS